MPKKTAEDYAANILEIHTELSKLPAYHPDVEKLTRQLSNRLDKWQKLLDITIYVANNEQTPWELEGMNIKPMFDKKTSGYPQVGDYLFTITDGAQIPTWGNLCVERKGGKTGPEDIYGTLMNREGRERFYREIDRYEKDHRFNQMIIIAECTMQQFLSYTPKFNGKRYNNNHTGASAESRRATIAGLFARGVPVLWAGNRTEAQKTFIQLVRQSCIKNYKAILNLE